MEYSEGTFQPVSLLVKKGSKMRVQADIYKSEGRGGGYNKHGKEQNYLALVNTVSSPYI